MNGDGLDPIAGVALGNYVFGYVYPPSVHPAAVPTPFTRHGKGDNYAWADGHASMSTWQVMSNGLNGQVDWYYMTKH